MKIALLGYGKMGRAIEEIAQQKNHPVVLKIDDQNLHELTETNIRKADVAIEFTTPESAVKNIMFCFNAGVPVVCGTTGWLSQLNMIQEKCKEKNAAFLYASNFSIGVNIFFELNKKLAQMMRNLPDYDVTIEETHHTQKKDAPSGTAITLAEQIISSSKQKTKWVLTDNNKSAEKSDLMITSKRIDPAAGTHSIKYTSPVDDIEIIHTAHNRKGFAGGAVLAAEFLAGKKGIYSMKDVLNF